MRDGFLAPDVLASLAGGDEGQSMPVVRRADDDRVNVLLLQQSPEVLELFRRRLAGLGRVARGVVQMMLIHVANRRGPHAFELEQLLPIIAALGAATDQ